MLHEARCFTYKGVVIFIFSSYRPAVSVGHHIKFLVHKYRSELSFKELWDVRTQDYLFFICLVCWPDFLHQISSSNPPFIKVSVENRSLENISSIKFTQKSWAKWPSLALGLWLQTCFVSYSVSKTKADSGWRVFQPVKCASATFVYCAHKVQPHMRGQRLLVKNKMAIPKFAKRNISRQKSVSLRNILLFLADSSFSSSTWFVSETLCGV